MSTKKATKGDDVSNDNEIKNIIEEAASLIGEDGIEEFLKTAKKRADEIVKDKTVDGMTAAEKKELRGESMIEALLDGVHPYVRRLRRPTFAERCEDAAWDLGIKTVYVAVAATAYAVVKSWVSGPAEAETSTDADLAALKQLEDREDFKLASERPGRRNRVEAVL
jgi:hypothetical protein